MITPGEAINICKKKIKKEWKIAFLSAFILGMFIHLPIMVSDIPNHDGLSSIYFDQNMITSGRWFLTIACGISSYFTLPWLIGLLGIFYLACAAVALTEVLEIHDNIVIMLIGGLLVAFPSLASTFAYVFTLDGYMMALLLAILAVLFSKKYKRGFWCGAICLALSMGIYQAYLPFAMMLCIYCIVIRFMEEGHWKEKIAESCRFLYMGVLGAGLYFVILQLLLKIQGKELASYQGINGMEGAGTAQVGLLTRLMEIYKDFFLFTAKGHALFNNVFSAIGLMVLAVIFVIVMINLILKRKWWKNPCFFVIIGLLVIGVPIATNVILIISPDVTYHLLMRYQWVLFPILLVTFVSRYGKVSKLSAWLEWGLACAVLVLVFNYAVTVQIGYSNLEKRYEKTYAYCVRLLDRIEQAEGYYQGIPIAMIGVVGDEEFPTTDITNEVTGGMIGLSGDSLLYTAANYQLFLKNYLGATLNFLDADTVGEIYYREEYIAMDSFPGENSVKVVDGILYVKTENVNRE